MLFQEKIEQKETEIKGINQEIEVLEIRKLELKKQIDALKTQGESIHQALAVLGSFAQQHPEIWQNLASEYFKVPLAPIITSARLNDHTALNGNGNGKDDDGARNGQNDQLEAQAKNYQIVATKDSSESVLAENLTEVDNSLSTLDEDAPKLVEESSEVELELEQVNLSNCVSFKRFIGKNEPAAVYFGFERKKNLATRWLEWLNSNYEHCETSLYKNGDTDLDGDVIETATGKIYEIEVIGLTVGQANNIALLELSEPPKQKLVWKSEIKETLPTAATLNTKFNPGDKVVNDDENSSSCGSVGTVIRFVPEAERYIVEFSHGEVRFKEKDLSLLQVAPGEPMISDIVSETISNSNITMDQWKDLCSKAKVKGIEAESLKKLFNLRFGTEPKDTPQDFLSEIYDLINQSTATTVSYLINENSELEEEYLNF